MNHYETVYIIHPAIQEGRLNDIVAKFKTKIDTHKGKFLYVENWGKKKLSYPIEKQKYGTYVMCQYSLEGGLVSDISKDLELNPNILRYLVTKIEQEDIKEGSNTLDHVEKNISSKTSTLKEEAKDTADIEDNNNSENDKQEDLEEDSPTDITNQDTDDTKKEGVK